MTDYIALARECGARVSHGTIGGDPKNRRLGYSFDAAQLAAFAARIAQAAPEDDWQAKEDGERAIECLEMHGFRRCDIPACNCGSWHGGHASNRLQEIGYALESVGLSNRGKTLLQEVEALIAEHDAALSVAPSQDREDARAVLADVRWRINDVRDMLMSYRIGGERLYGIDEWSTPAVNLQLAIAVLDAALAARQAPKEPT